AIYRFRGGDVHAYRRAAERADSVERLGESYRAEPPVVDAVNALFDPNRVVDPFVEDFIAYVPVAARYDASRHGALVADGDAHGAGMHVWPVRPDDGGAWSGKEKAGRQVMADVAS